MTTTRHSRLIIIGSGPAGYGSKRVKLPASPAGTASRLLDRHYNGCWIALLSRTRGS